MKQRLILTFLVLTLPLAVLWQAPWPWQVMATFEGGEITRAELDHGLAVQQATVAMQTGITVDYTVDEVARASMLTELIQRRLVLAHGAANGVYPDPERGEREVNNLFPDLTPQVLRPYGVARADLAAWFSETIAVDTYADTLLVDAPSETPGLTYYNNWLNELMLTANVELNPAAFPGPGARVGEIAPDFTLTGTDGSRQSLSDYRGRAVVLNFWATWCGPCAAETPQLEKIYQQFRSQGIVVVGVDIQEPPAVVAAFADKLGLTYPMLLDEEGRVSSLLYRLRGMPMTVFLDREGVIRDIQVGPIGAEIVQERLETLGLVE